MPYRIRLFEGLSPSTLDMDEKRRMKLITLVVRDGRIDRSYIQSSRQNESEARVRLIPHLIS